MSRSTFNILFYANKSKEKNGIVPIMGRVTINGTQSQFSCKKNIPLTMWDVKGNCAKGRNKEALQINRDLDNIKAQIIKHNEPSIGIPSLGLFDTTNPVYDPAEEEFRRRIQKKKKKRGPRL